VRDAAAATLRVLKRIRRAAGPVRDLDVHRKLLGKLAKRALSREEVARHPEDAGAAMRAAVGSALETPQAALRVAPLGRQSDELDGWLKDRRESLAEELKGKAAAALPKFDKRVVALEAALQQKGLRRRKAKPLALVALEGFARLATDMQALHAGNLHDFRKGAKKARYVAELAASADLEAGRVGGTLKKLQDEIGDWHDWLVLAQEAHVALGDGATELIGLIEAERNRHFAAAMQMAAKLRGRLMGEWLAVNQLRSGQLKGGQLKGGQLRSGQLKTGQLKSGQLKGGQLRSGQLKTGQLKSGRAAAGR